jgi:hypothetical protein
MLVPATDRPIDELITSVYICSEIAIAIISCLRDPDCWQWSKSLWCELQIAMVDCKIVKSKIYYKDKLFLLPDDELRM